MTTAVPTYLKLLILATGLVLMASSPALAQSTGRKVADPNGRFAKITGELTQIKDPQGAGNAFVIGAQGCYIASNFHVAFAKSKDPVTGKVEILENADVGHTVNFAFDLDAKTGKFKKTVKATVVEFDNYEPETTTGFVDDLVILRLENCLGKEYAGPELDRPEAKKFVPAGRLMTVSTSRKGNDLSRNEILVEEGCRSESVTVIAGAFFLNCHFEPGMSGSMVLEQGADQQWRLVGISTGIRTLKDRSKKPVAIYSLKLTPFIESVIGEESIAISPVADERKPQSQDETTAMSGAVRVRTVVR